MSFARYADDCAWAEPTIHEQINSSDDSAVFTAYFISQY